MDQFWAHKEVIFVHCCVLQFAYCAVVMAEDFDAMEVCCKTVMMCVELEICNCLFSGFVFVVFSPPVDLMFYHCVLLDEAMASWENFSCVIKQKTQEKFYMFQASSAPIIRSYLLYARQLVRFLQGM